MVQELLRLTFLSGRFERFLRKKKGSYCECSERKSLTLGIKMKRIINEIEIFLSLHLIILVDRWKKRGEERRKC